MGRPDTDKEKETSRDDLKEFLLVLRRALLMITKWIERRYKITDQA